jgi:C-terminal processing protease CtpA/Prc
MIACIAAAGQSLKIDRPYVTQDPPQGLLLATGLSAQDRSDNFEALWSLIDANYADFKLKSIDWKGVGRRYRDRLKSVTNDDDYYLLLFQLVNELKDSHSWLQNYRPPVLQDVQDMPVDLFGGNPYIVAGPHAGSQVLSVDGMTIEAKIEALRPLLHACSTEHAFRRQAARRLLAGKAGTIAVIALRQADGAPHTVSAARTPGPSLRPRGPAFEFPVTRQKYVHFGVHPSGMAYVWIESFNTQDPVIGAEFDRALEHFHDNAGLILDIRDNLGGFGHTEIVGRLLLHKAVVAVDFIKNGPGHNALARHETTLGPQGRWTYRKPIALLVNEGTVGASDLFACELRSARRVITVGTTTHGDLSGVATFAVLPCGLVVRISNGYVCDAKGKPIEGNGNPPDVLVEPTIEDFLKGHDPVIEKAVSVLAGAKNPR